MMSLAATGEIGVDGVLNIADPAATDQDSTIKCLPARPEMISDSFRTCDYDKHCPQEEALYTPHRFY